MSFKNTKSAVLAGLEAFIVDIEVNIDNRGFPNFDIVGLAAKEINEAKERVKTAIRNSGFNFPSKKILVNLAPADLPKNGSMYDLPIAVGILAASGIIDISLSDFLFAGEVSLNGDLCKIPGSTLVAIEAKAKNKILVIPESNLLDVSFVKGLNILAYKNLKDLVLAFKNKKLRYIEIQNFIPHKVFEKTDLIENIKGHEFVKRAMLIAAAGRHNICLVGSAGSGKTLLARSLKTITPDIYEDDFLEVAKIDSITGENFSIRPKFRAPNYKLNLKSLIGSQNPFVLGEITLAHKGILFLDEFTEFDNKLINALRKPLEDKKIQFYNKKYHAVLPCDFMLVLAANPCACGNFGDPDKKCICNSAQIQRYFTKLKNPLMDRIDLFVNVFSISSEELLSKKIEPTSESLKKLAMHVRITQNLRCKKLGIDLKPNADLLAEEIQENCVLENDAAETMKSLHKKFSSRSVHKILKVARTIADLEDSENIKNEHVLEAVQYKSIF